MTLSLRCVRASVGLIVGLALACSVAAESTAAPKKKAAKRPRSLSTVEVVAPASGAVLSGRVAVRVKLNPQDPKHLPKDMFAGFDGPPWAKLTRQGESLEWAGEIDSQTVPNGEAVLQIHGWAPQDRRLASTAAVRINNPVRCYFADLHAHTRYSDGEYFPADAVAHARDVSKLDVFSLTDHLELLSDAEWSDVREKMYQASQEGRFVAIPGMEWTRSWEHGHACLFDPGTRHWPREIEPFFKAAADAGAVVKLNHPGDGTVMFNGLAYSEAGDRAVSLIEVRNPKEEQAFLRALKNGWHVAPDGSSDTHTANWGSGGHWTGLVMPSVTRRNVWAALKQRHCFSTFDRNCQVSFTINNDAIMGDRITVAPAKAELQLVVSVDDPDSGDKTAKIELFEDGAVVQTVEPKAEKYSWSLKRTPKLGDHYFFAKITQADGNPIWLAPIWVRVGDPVAKPEAPKPAKKGGAKQAKAEAAKPAAKK